MRDYLFKDGFADEYSEVGVIGPSITTYTSKEIIENGIPFQMKDDDGILYYEGIYLGDDSDDMFAPLNDFGEGNAGCTSIWYKNSVGEWEEL